MKNSSPDLTVLWFDFPMIGFLDVTLEGVVAHDGLVYRLSLATARDR